MPITNRDEFLKEIYNQIDAKNSLLPKFQRGFVWNKAKQRSLIASFLADLPFGSLLYLNGSKTDFVTRELCFPSAANLGDGTCQFVLDGQQRLSTLRNAFYNLYIKESWVETFDNIYSPLKVRWYLRVKPEHEDLDLFGLENLRFKDFNQYTDSDFEDFIESKDIFKTRDLESPYHPGFSPKTESGEYLGPNEIKNKIAKLLAEDKQVPLYEVSLGRRGIHNKVISNIADDRAAELEASLADDGYSSQYILDLFAGIREIDSLSDVEEIREGLSDEELQQVLKDYFSDLKTQWKNDFTGALNSLVDRRLPIIELTADETHRAVSIFEAINRGGIQLTVFELLVAKAASINEESNYDLLTLIVGQLESSLLIPNSIKPEHGDEWTAQWLSTLNGKEPVSQFKEWFVNVLSVLVHGSEGEEVRVEHLKRERILSLNREQISNHSEQACIAIIRALAFLNLRCGVISVSDLMYKLILIPIARVLANNSNWNSSVVINKLEYWYWVTIFSGRYTFRQNEKCAFDLSELINLIDENNNKYIEFEARVLESEVFCTKDSLMRKPVSFDESTSQVKKAIVQYVLSKPAYDFVSTSQSQLSPWLVSKNAVKVEIHHIMPLTSATSIEQSTRSIRENKDHILNSPLNMTPISKNANQKIKDRAPGDYLSHLNNLILSSHCIPTEVGLLATSSEYEAFLASRYQLLKNDILGKLGSLKSSF